MDRQGWVDIQQLIDNANKYKNLHLDIETVKLVVETNDKQRFIISDDGKKIRANQGHSISIDLGITPQTPPDELYHGTATRFINSIKKDGIKPISRQYVHLSKTMEIAETVGKRHGKVIVLHIDAKLMNEEGHMFYLSENNVWLVDFVPKKYIKNREVKN
jgi:putative RNA 2'-phosphotransferase